MVACAARAVLVAVMVLPHVPLAVLVALLFAATMFAPPFESARAAITPEILQGERYVLGTAVLQTTFLTSEVLVWDWLGGVAVAFIGVRKLAGSNTLNATKKKKKKRRRRAEKKKKKNFLSKCSLQPSLVKGAGYHPADPAEK